MKNDKKSRKNDATQVNVWQGRKAIKRPTEVRIPMMDVSKLSKVHRTAAGIGASNTCTPWRFDGGLVGVWKTPDS
ncbi:hypothetical protein SAMN05444392_101356 [Seinonella peptonophila]|uniref:Uncharacterized protein n=1 Tax=Seinonella peptonophila TaxID=112248 RepID=A0A1M4T8L8_9BACL|nr:hypothetical protein [Seinonella peptonophila]SHE40678.1 hypothetical protein SAMN05444392_101356 [Seinonella peptonophila]